MSEVAEQSSSHKVFVGNVPFQCTKEEFMDCFKEYEGFLSADVICKRNSKVSRGFGFVEFETEEQALKLMDVEDMELKDRVLRFSKYSFDDSRKKQEGSNRVFVRGLGENTTEEAVRAAFTALDKGTLDSVHLNKDRDTGECRGSGWVAFSTEEEANAVLDLDSVDVDGNACALYRFRANTQRKAPRDNYKQHAKAVYQNGYRDGYTVGYQEGLKAASRQKVESAVAAE